MSALTDSHGRTFRYLRLSITDVCNFRCTYCLPNGYQKPCGAESALDLNEIRNLVSAFSELGVSKVRITGGEPSVRRDLVEVVSQIAEVPGVQKVALSTNGWSLKNQAVALKRAGLSALNVSVDSLNPKVFESITGKSNLGEILSGIDMALDVGIAPVKINAVLMNGINDDAIDSFLEWIKHKPISVRFIELMRTGRNSELFQKHHVSGEVVRARLVNEGWYPVARQETDGPAQAYAHSDYLGTIGVIAPYSKEFCASCNRLRVSSSGKLRLCLFGDGDYSLRPLLQSSTQKLELIDRISLLLGQKQKAHALHEGKYGNTWNLSAIGG